MKTVALIVAGGSSERFGGELPKQYMEIAGEPLLSHTIEKFEKADSVDSIVLVVAEDYLAYTSENIVDPFNFQKVSKIVSGGKSRRESVLNGLKSLSSSTSFVAIHDAARPLVSTADINNVIEAVQKEKAAILASQAVDTIKQSSGGYIETTLERKKLFQAQTPQVFEYELILNAHESFNGDESLITDDASLLELQNIKIKLVEPTSANFKVTTKTDFQIAEMILQKDEHV